MKGTGEINEVVKRSCTSTEAVHLRPKKNESSLDQRKESSPNSMFISSGNDLHGKVSLSGNLDLLKDNLKGKDQMSMGHTSSPSRSVMLGVDPQNATEAHVKVQELTIENYKHSSMSLPGHSNRAGVIMPVTTDLRNNFYNLQMGKPKDIRYGTSGANFSFNHHLAQSQKQLKQGYGNDNHAILSDKPTTSPMNDQSTVLPTHNFQKFMGKNILQDNGPSYNHPRSHGVVERNQKHVLKGSPNFLHDFSPRSNSPHQISLRHFLKTNNLNVNKQEMNCIFKQVVELVHDSHSKGFALQKLQPSHFMILPSNRVRYVGSFIANPQTKQPDNDSSQLENRHHLKRKIPLYKNDERYHMLQAKHPKLNQYLESGFRFNNARQHIYEDYHSSPFFSSEATIDNSKIFLRKNHLEDTWYASEDDLNNCSASIFSSNIYSLGVLFFELFCKFESSEVHAAAMLDLRHRILPSDFLSENPKEAGFCLWLLHPHPSSRPMSREVIQSDLICPACNIENYDHLAVSLQEKSTEAELLFHFLSCLKEQKEILANKLVGHINYIGKDIEEVEKRRSYNAEYLSTGMINLDKVSDKNMHKEPSSSGKISDLSFVSNMNEVKNFDKLEKAYFLMRSRIEHPETRTVQLPIVQEYDSKIQINNNPDHLGAFFDGLCKYARYNKFVVRGTIRSRYNHNFGNVICSLDFDRDGEYFAAAGAAKKIKIFEYSSLLNDTVDIHYPVTEMPNKSKLSCVCWNNYIKNYLASTDYDGAVKIWDASTSQVCFKYTEHQSRAWSVDFSKVNPTKMASASDDSTVKLWNINEKNSTSTIKSIANVCCVQFSAYTPNLLAFGSADYNVYCYDIRNAKVPLHTLVGHKKTVSYVKFVDSETLISASIDGSIKLWDLNKSSSDACKMNFAGHTNDKNFVGLSVSNGYISCGSETNEVYAYYKSLPMPITSHKFGSIDPISNQESTYDNGHFVSSVCWREKSDMVVSASSSGCIKLLQMV